MEDAKKYKISETEKNRLLIKNLNDRPNAMATFGKAKLSPDQIKDIFDRQFEILVERHNGLCDETGAVLDNVEQRMTEQDTVIARFAARIDSQDVAVSEFGARIDMQDANIEAFEERINQQDKTLSDSIAAQNKIIGDLDSALDELHDYAEALIGGA